ncbi:MAG: hypothetical protein ACRDFY_07405 [Candidatus Limnocylindria bacterium]
MRNRTTVIAGTALLLVLSTTAVLALWSAQGTGSGRAEATTAVTATVTPVDCSPSPACADLYPGFTEGDLYFTITNANPYEVTFTDMTAGAITVDALHAPDCPAASVAVDSPVSGLNLVAPASSTTGQLSIPDVVSMIVAAPDGCQGASFDIVLTLTGSQS